MASITQLFLQKNVEEMKELERKTRHEIELKKEELRQMVGERYRDLIEAADTIDEMKTCSTNVRDSIKDLRQFCSSNSLTKQRRAFSLKKQRGTKNVSRYMEVAAEAKVLMEMPEKIWSLVESGHMINASLLYLQSLQVLKNLSLDGSTSYSPVLLWFPMLGQQAQAVGNLRAAILKESHSLLLDHLLPTEKLAEALCAIVVLENSKISEALRVLLKARSSVLKQTLSNDITSRGARKNIGAKAQICDGADIMKHTVVQVYELFCNDSGGLVAELLTKHCSSAQNMATIFLGQQDSTKLWTKYLPCDNTTSQIYSDPNSFVISPEIVQSCCLAWLAESEEEMKRGVQQLLKFTTTAKDLASIRSSLLEVLAESVPEEKVAEDIDQWTGLDYEPTSVQPSQWDVQCKIVFNREVHLWKEVLQVLFVEKINSIIKVTFKRLFEQSKDVLAQCGDLQSEMDVCSYVWSEHDNDISSDMAWNQWQTRKHNDLASQSGLSLKSVTITPNIQFVCKGINQTMSEFLSDLNHYTADITSSQSTHSPKHRRTHVQKGKEAEDKNVVENLKTSCLEFLHTLISHTQHLRKELQQNAIDFDVSQHTLDQSLYLSLVCRNFFKLCHSFKQCCCPQDTNPQSSFRRQLSDSMNKLRVDSSKDADTSAWNTVVNNMIEESHKFMSIWCTAVLDSALKIYEHSLLSSAVDGNLLKSVALWDSVAVEEESETGDKITSQIKIPASTTTFTQKYLYDICSEVNRVGGYSASRHTLQCLSQGCLKGVYQAFSEARRKLSSGDANLHGQSRKSGETATPTQSWALQCLFDLRYCHSLLHHSSVSNLNEDHSKDEECDEMDDDHPLYTFTELVDWLEGYIDPFDLDVFSPHLTRNIQRHVTRTCVLLGILASPDKMNSATQKFTTMKDSHNVFPLSTECARFPYLPIAGRSSSNRSTQRMSSLSRQLPLANALRELTRSTDEDEKQQNGLTSSIYSKLGALSSSWLSMSSSYSED